MLKYLTDFLKVHWDPTRPLLLALSGGSDSLALLFLLREIQKKCALQLHIAHVDHGWREASSAEAATLKDLAERSNIPFHTRRLNPRELTGNLEAACRFERLNFFRTLTENYGFQAVLLGHHGDDQAETVLKRVFEGASLACLGGLKEVSSYEGLLLWRPLLSFSKETIAAWLNAQGEQGFMDASNADTRFLRARMRCELLPLLSQGFGKQVNPGLQALGQQAQEFDAYMDEKLKTSWLGLERGALGLLWDFSHQGLVPFEIKYLLHKLAKKEGLFLSREALETAQTLLCQGIADRVIETRTHRLYIDRSRLYIMRHAHLTREMSQERVLNPGPLASGWKQVWLGEGTVFLPEGNYELKMAAASDLYPGSSPIGKWWNNAKVPAFLRRITPVVWQNGKIVHEFLSGRVKSVANLALKVSLKQKELIC